jgi:CheY-like chemotaxis protein
MASSAPGSADTRVSVLIVEDHAASAAGYEQLLSAHGYQVRVARDGYQALSEIAREQPSVVLLDLKVPKLDGWDLLDRLHRQAREQDAPAVRVIVITGDALATHHDLAKSRGAHDVLTKPVEPPRLLRAIEAALS